MRIIKTSETTGINLSDQMGAAVTFRIAARTLPYLSAQTGFPDGAEFADHFILLTLRRSLILIGEAVGTLDRETVRYARLGDPEIQLDTRPIPHRFALPITAMASASYGRAQLLSETMLSLESDQVPTTEFLKAFKEDVELSHADEAYKVLSYPLWRTTPEPEISDQIDHFIKWLYERDGFDFWARWYTQLLNGGDHPWEMWAEIALIPDEDWRTNDPEHIARLIAEIEAKHLGKATPYSVDVALSEGGDSLVAVATQLTDARLYETALERVRFAIEELAPDAVLAQHHFGLARTLTRLQRALERYAENPQFIHEEFLASARQIERLKAEGEVADDEAVDLLQRSLITGSEHIQAADEKVRASFDALTRLRLERLDREDAATAVEKLETVRSMSAGELVDALEDTAEQIEAAASGKTDEETAIAIYRGAALMPRARRVVDRVVKAGRAYAEGSGFAKLAAEHYPAYEWLVRFFLNLLA